MYAQTQSVLLSEVKVSKSLSGVETRQILVCVCVCVILRFTNGPLLVHIWWILHTHATVTVQINGLL